MGGERVGAGAGERGRERKGEGEREDERIEERDFFNNES
jgi:hypothetical protein